MEWVKFQKPGMFGLEHPAGWTVQVLPGPTAIVSSADRQAVVAIQTMHGKGTGDFSPANIIKNGMYTAAYLFPQARDQVCEAGENDSVFCVMRYTTTSGAPGRGQLAFMAKGDGGILYAIGGPEAGFDGIEPTLMRVMQTFKLETAGVVGAAKSAPIVAAAPVHTPPPPVPKAAAVNMAGVNMAGALGGMPAIGGQLSFVKFTEPQMGSFTMDVPVGWQVRGGLAHPMPGDRRAWIEAISPDGIYIVCDPSFPQSFCHFPGQAEGQFTQMAAGGAFLNLKPSAEKAADCYLKNIVPGKYPGAKAVARRARGDLVELVNSNIRKMGYAIPQKAQTTAIQVDMELTQGGQPRIGTLLCTCFFNGEYTMGMWAFWNAVVYLTIAPPYLTAKADEATLRMMRSCQDTPKMFEIAQRDEAIITANGQAANAQQWNWFAGQQAVHNAQTAMGNTIVNNYWQTQAANDSLIKGWEQNQAVYDHLSESRADEMLDRQRLVDEGQGKEYAVAAGANYYWLNPQTNVVVGTETNTPPDYSSNYILLKKL